MKVFLTKQIKAGNKCMFVHLKMHREIDLPFVPVKGMSTYSDRIFNKIMDVIYNERNGDIVAECEDDDHCYFAYLGKSDCEDILEMFEARIELFRSLGWKSEQNDADCAAKQVAEIRKKLSEWKAERKKGMQKFMGLFKRGTR